MPQPQQPEAVGSGACPLCGYPLDGYMCRLVCPNCGYKEDCSDAFTAGPMEPPQDERPSSDQEQPAGTAPARRQAQKE